MAGIATGAARDQTPVIWRTVCHCAGAAGIAAMTIQSTRLSEILATESGIDAGYRHRPKRVNPGEPIEPKGTLLKWYGINYEDRPIPEAITRLARAHLLKTSLEARGLGFVLLHRCGEDFYFLIVCTWRGNNELWETVFYKDGDKMADFALFPRNREHKGSYCVWEMVPVWHEQKAWERFLNSARDEAAARAWFEDRTGGLT
jgi:hypothetical protein